MKFEKFPFGESRVENNRELIGLSGSLAKLLITREKMGPATFC